MSVAERLATLEPIGLSAAGTNRLAWTPEDAAAGEWFAAQAASVGLRVERDLAGNRWAVPAGDGPWWGVGSHTDSVRDGGRFDGALGVAAGFEVAARCSKPVAVVSFADEEGARFNTPTFGSRALVGTLDVDDALARVDDDGVSLRDAMAAAGIDPEGLRRAPERLGALRGFLELHIDQTRDVDAAGAPYGVVRALAARLRVRVELRGSADHAGTTSMAERRDAMAAAARIVVAGLDAASPAAASPELRVTPGRLLVEPNALTTIASRVTLWLDARAEAMEPVEAWLAELERAAREIAEAARVELELRVESRSEPTVFDGALRARLGEPEVVCFAGHDAGNVGRVVPAAMLLVRNPTGVSHARDEEVDVADAEAAVDAMVAVLEEVT